VRYPIGALKACTNRVKGQNANSANASRMWNWKLAGTPAMISGSGEK
jgi:hypothetical protein